MNNNIILGISVLALIIVFIIIILLIGKSKIKELLTPLEISRDDINNYLKQKYKLYKLMIKYIKENLSIKEDAFSKFLQYDTKECVQSELINVLQETTAELNEYVDNYDELEKSQEFMDLKKKLYVVEINLEATIDYFNNKLNTYNNLKGKPPTSLGAKFYDFDEFNLIPNEKDEISRLINLN